jgi:hypothetical protein
MNGLECLQKAKETGREYKPHGYLFWHNIDSGESFSTVELLREGWELKPEPREFWVNDYGKHCSPHIHKNKEDAIRFKSKKFFGETIKVREVLED